MRPVAGWLVAISMMAAPAIAAGPDGEYDPCKNRGPRRIAIVFARRRGGRRGRAARGTSTRTRRRCVRATPSQWSVINACDVEEVSDIRLEGLERVAEKCSAVRQLDLAANEGDPVPAPARLPREREAGVRGDGPDREEPADRRSRSSRSGGPELDEPRPSPAIWKSLGDPLASAQDAGGPRTHLRIVGMLPAGQGDAMSTTTVGGVPGGEP